MFELWMIIYVVGALICFAVAYRKFFAKEKLTQSRKLFGLLTLLFGLICIIDFLAQVAGPTKLSVYLQHLLAVLYPFPVFLLMLIPQTLYRQLKGITILKILVLPLLLGLFTLIAGGNVIDAEAENFGNTTFVKFIYNETVYSTWLFLNFIPFIGMYYFFYKIYKSLDLRAKKNIMGTLDLRAKKNIMETLDLRANKDAMKRLRVFVLAFTILIIVCYAFAIAEMIFGTPPLSSVGAAVGVSLAMIAFKLRKEMM